MTRAMAVLCLAAALATAQPSTQADASDRSMGLRIAADRPRLWWTPERLAQARSWYASNPFTPRRDDYLAHAFRYLMTGETSHARAAIDFAMGVQANLTGVASNDARWHGQTVILTYDWCYDQMTEAERATLIERWNGYLDELRRKPWGGLTMPQNNYFWGYLRNEFLWAVATWHENPAAPGFLDHALNARWRNSFLPHANSWGRGGVLHEGSQYGRYLLDYFTVPAVSARLMGRNLLDETNYFKEAVYYLIYATTPSRTALKRDGSMRWEIFPFADDQWFVDGGNAEDSQWANFMSVAADVWRDEPVGQYARRWQKTVAFPPSRFIAAADRGGAERDFSSLPLDYYAPGTRYLYGRNQWGARAMAFHLQLGNINDGGAHDHADYGNWQIWRNGRWLSRETTGYARTIAGYAGEGAVETNHPLAHNTLLVNGKGVRIDWDGAGPKVKRLESRPAFAYAAVDLSPAFKDPAVSRVEREFLFIRQLETMVVFDRMATTTADATRTFLAHFERQPKMEGAGGVVPIAGGQVLRIDTLLPPAPVYRVIDEGGPVGQYRLEVDDAGQTLGYFLHVLQAGDAPAPALEARLGETAEAYTLDLRHPGMGHFRVVFQKGENSAGGSFGCSHAGPPKNAVPLLDRVQGIEVRTEGPVWEKLDDSRAQAALADCSVPSLPRDGDRRRQPGVRR